MLDQLQSTAAATLSADALPAPIQHLALDGTLLVDTPELTDDEAVDALRALLLGRRFDERCVNLQRRGLMVTLAPGIGQEACSVGSVIPLDRTRDWFVPQYREAAGQLLHGLPLAQAFLWHMGSPLGFCIPEGVCMLPFNAAVAGQIPHAVGLGWGLRLRGQDSVVVVHFGEGATSQGDFHEAINLAGVVKAPVVFFCQNNFWAISTPRDLQTASATIAQKAVAYGIPGIQVDGNDVFAVVSVMREAIARARRGEGPTLIEGITYRLGMHTTADDGASCEPAGMRDSWRPKDPLLRLQRYLEARGRWSEAIGNEMDTEIAATLDAAWAEAQATPTPTVSESLAHVFAHVPDRLAAQGRRLEEDR
ncbi:MAG: pyruvate dehydrogenase (acetyl-transferring) E1 component subunit alpha [Acidobacteria bacterium]|nr:pyruvate dehydrogenase (acetyl-transferring) E1 component subunit alpha [Acidobacteriota bacterium]